MNLASFLVSIEDSVKFLKSHSLFKNKGFKNIGSHSDDFKKVCRKNRHTEMFNVAIANNDFEILLFDDSIFQFSIDNGTLRYAFIQNPNLFVSKDDYIGSLYTPADLVSMSEEEYDELITSVTDEEYEQFFNEQEINLKSHIIRYDFDVNGHSPLVHSCSHIHIGLNENLRISCAKKLTPLKFVIFVIKNTYYDTWKNYFVGDENACHFINASKNQCIDLSEDHWNELENMELHLR